MHAGKTVWLLTTQQQFIVVPTKFCAGERKFFESAILVVLVQQNNFC